MPPGDLDPEEFRDAAHRTVDLLADYLANVERYPVLAQTEPGDVRRSLPVSAPMDGEALDRILADVEDIVVPGLTHWQSPGFMAYFAITGSGPGILGDLLAAGFNVNAMLWQTSPAATELEEVTLDWLRQLVGLPEPLFGCINDTASSSTLYALAAAREAIPDACIRERGLSGRSDIGALRYYASEEAHSSVEKAGIVLGTGREGCVRIPTDAEFRMDVDALASAIRADRAAGRLPFAVVATAGTTSTTSVDPVRDIARLCAREGLWLHVDAAYAGAAAVVPELRWVLDGCDAADSIVVNPHKWLFTPIDCSVLWTRRRDVLRDAFTLVPEYLRTAHDEDTSVINLNEYGTSLGRRFRALKLWMVIRTFGASGLAERIREHVRLAQLLSGWVDSSAMWERTAPARLSTVCLRAHPPGVDDEERLAALNERVKDRINRAGRHFISHTALRGRITLHAAIGNLRTQERHVRGLWDELQSALAAERGAESG